LLGLGPSDFTLTVDGQKVGVLDAHTAAEPLSVVLIVHAPLRDMAPVRAAMQTIVDALTHPGLDVRLALLSKEGTPVAFTSLSQAAFGKTLMALLADPSSSAQGLIDAARALAHEGDRRRVIVALNHPDTNMSGSVRTDGRGPLEPNARPNWERQALQAAAAQLWCVEAQPESSGTPVDQFELMFPHEAQLSGGLCEEVHDVVSFDGSMRRLMGLLLWQYVVTFDAAHDQATHTLRVGVTRKNAKVYAPSWLGQ
jgi:hypothetical protein